MKNVTNRSARVIYKALSLFYLFLVISLPVFSQGVVINTTGNPANASAGLDVDFSDKGLLIPRVALTGTASPAPLTAHVAGMMVYNTATAGNVVPGFYYDDGTKWIPGLPAGNTAGDMMFWNGGSWVIIPAGTAGQFLQSAGSGMPVWVTSPASSFPMATIITTPASAITGITASGGGNITSDGGLAVLNRGICWNSSPNPTIANTKTSDGSGTGVFTSSMTGLLPVTTYYVKAYAINSAVVSYGNEVSFTTLPVLPTVTTIAATAITGTTANSGGNVTSTGGATITERGICYSTSPNPTTASSKVVDPSPGPGVFISNLTGLTPGTTYYIRAYAINGAGTAYGNQVSFTTLQVPPTIVTVAATGITPSSAISGGTYTLNGVGGNLWNYGVAIATTPGSLTPTYVQTGGSVIPSPWVTNLTGLLGSQVYYYRAYIQGYWNGASAYDFGNELSFTTDPPVIPTVTTTAISNIGPFSANSGGNVTNNGGAPVTTRGVCWSTSPNPDTLGSKIASGSGNGTFPVTLTPLLASTTYYVRAYATNSVGVAYGNEVSFATCGAPIYNVGDSALGGIVFYVDCTGQHGLIAAMMDQGTVVQYGCSGTLTGASGTAIYTGAANTAAILTNCSTSGIAARMCHDYAGGGFLDWYLPSSGELQEMYNKRGVIPNLTYGLFTYWSSTEASATIAGGYFFTGGYSVSVAKSYGTQMVCRAVRAF